MHAKGKNTENRMSQIFYDESFGDSVQWPLGSDF